MTDPHTLPDGGFRAEPHADELAVDIESTSLDPKMGSILSCAVAGASGTTAWWVESPDDLRAVADVLGGPRDAAEKGEPAKAARERDARHPAEAVVPVSGTLRVDDGEVPPPVVRVGDRQPERRGGLPRTEGHPGTVSDGALTRAEGTDVPAGGGGPMSRDHSASLPPKLIVHHVPMEGGWSEEFFGHDRKKLPSRFVDTALLAYRVDPGESMKLASVAARHLPELSGWKTETEALLVDSPSMLELPREEVLRRNAVDAHVTYALKQKLWEKLSKEEQDLHEEDVAISLLNSRMAKRGMVIDEGRLIELRRKLTGVMKEETSWIRKFTGVEDLNPGSSQQMGEVIEKRGVSLPKTDGGAPSVNGMALRVLRHDTSDTNLKELIDHLLSFRKAQDMIGDNVTQYALARSGDGRVRSSLFWPGTFTWRPASHDPNLLNVPRTGVRQLFTAPPGMAVIEADLSQAELRVMAALSQDPVLVAGFRDRTDFHTRRAQRVYDKAEVSKGERYVGKKFNFSCGYGIGDEHLWEAFAKEDLILPFSLVQRGKRDFWLDFAGLKKHREEVLASIRKGDTQYAPTGGYRWNLTQARLLHPKSEEDAANSLYNARIQAVPPRLMYRACLRLEDDIELVLMPYDALIGYVPIDAVVDVARKIKEIVREVTSEPWWNGVECPCDIKSGPSWGELVEVVV